MENYKFRVDFLEEAKEFLDGLNIWKVRNSNDKELFKKLQGEIWEFRTKFNKTYYHLFAFWDKTNKTDTIVISTHGLIKKVDKISKNEIQQAEKLRERYFNEKMSKK